MCHISEPRLKSDSISDTIPKYSSFHIRVRLQSTWTGVERALAFGHARLREVLNCPLFLSDALCEHAVQYTAETKI